jgi:hypothetical protein
MADTPSKPSRPLLFLDFDGVLNSSAFFVRRGPYPKETEFTRRESEIYDLDPEAVARLNKVIKVTRCDIVVSSTWRLGRKMIDLREILGAKGFRGRIVGKTPDSYRSRVFGVKHLRAHDIAAYLRCLSTTFEQPHFAIVDDDTDAGVGYEKRFVKTDVMHGLLDEDADKLIAILGER